MTQQPAPQPRTKTWTLNLEILEESRDATSVAAALEMGEKTLRTSATAQRNPGDPPAPDIGDEYAAGRALLDLGRQLLRVATVDAASNEGSAAHEPPTR